jgi:ferric-dicitrate binding protein FerR (iron transport regulator)
MNRFDNVINRLRWPKGKRASGVDPVVLDAALERTVEGVRDADADTERQWARLHGTLETSGAGSGIAPASPKKVRYAFAGGLALAVAGVLVVLLLKGLEPAPLLYQTARGEIRHIMLADSSEVTLNHSSSLSVRRSLFDKSRLVELSGEAYFAVRSNGAPFTVHTAVGRIDVSGTAFNVRERQGFLEVAVTRGAVSFTATRPGRDSTIRLTEGYQTTCRSRGFPDAAEPLRFARFPGWLYGELQFYRAPLSSVLWEIEQRFDVSVEVEQQVSLETTITGTLHGRDPYAVLSAVCALTGLNLRDENRKYTLY